MEIMRSWLFNRFALTALAIVVVAGIWNIYVAFNDDGIIEGQVIDADGAPVTDATVRLSERTLLVARPRGTVSTDASGYFRFDGHRMHHFYIEAEKEGLGQAGPIEHRLYFQGQNLRLDDPITLNSLDS